MDIKNNSFQMLAHIVGTSMAKNLKEQIGETVDENKIKEIKQINPTRPTKKHPQMTLNKFT